MIVVEGPDGSGKTTLLEQLTEEYPSIPLHERASNGIHGPVQNLYDWAHMDVHTWNQQPLSFYDRHPLVSEYIYGPVTRGKMDPRFITTPLRYRFARRALVIVCLPPLSVVRRSVSDERDMPGVTTHIDAIWHLYASLRTLWPASGGLITYDYTKGPDQLDMLFPIINHHKATWQELYTNV